ncbi:MAG: glycoside hydrolase domain-containing protein [Thermoguttaceae bacterium]
MVSQRLASSACLAFLFTLAGATARADLHVWTVTETRRVLRDERPENRPQARLAAARNEWEGFQILLRSSEPVQALRIEPADLLGPGGAILRAADARLYRQHQIQLAEGTYRNDRFKPGWYPDPLIPTVHPLTGKPLVGARYTAMPFDLPANETHGFWVDLYVPPDAKPGVYEGTYRLTWMQGAQPRAHQLPVSITVWDFTLPEVPTLVTAFGSPAQRMRGYYRRRAQEGKEPEPADWETVETQCAQLLSEHRFNATPWNRLAPERQPDGSFRIPQEQIRQLRQFVDRYHVNAVQTVHPRSAVKDPDTHREQLHAWLKAWDRAAAELERPHVLFYTYLLDEPNTEEAYREVQQWGRAIRQAKSALKVMVVEQTKTQDPAWGNLDGAVDIWCPLFCLHDPETAQQRLALGESIWTYTALCQGRQPSPWWHLDYPLLNYRVPAWIAWRYRMTGLLYWGGMSYWDRVEDPWTDARTYGRKPGQTKGPIFNGEGTIVYPARPAGYDGIVPSLRLKALRDSIEDYQYLDILQRQGQRPQAEKIVLALADSFFRWDPDPAKYQQARARLAAMIVATQRK